MGESGSEVSHLISEPRKFSEVKNLSYEIKKHWPKAKLKDIKNLINNHTFIVAKYLDTVTFKVSKKFYKTTLPSDMIFTKADASTSDEQVEKLTREFSIHYRACIGSFFAFYLQEWI